MMPRVFVASAADDLLAVSVLAELLGRAADVTAWTEDVFTLSAGSLSGLQRTLEASDYAIFVASAQARKTTQTLSPNLIVEIGMSIALLGADRTALLSDDKSRIALPADLRTLEHVRFRAAGDDGALRKNLRPAAAALRRWMRYLGPRAERAVQPAEPSDVMPEVAARGERANDSSGPKALDRRSSVFISYAHADQKWLTQIKTMLTPLIRTDRISVWDDSRIKPGSKWRGEIKKALASAKVALLLVSPQFLASPFIADEELPPILEAAKKEGLVIVWALVSACLYKKTPIAEYQAAHPIAKPLDSLATPKRNQALLSIAETIGAALERR